MYILFSYSFSRTAISYKYACSTYLMSLLFLIIGIAVLAVIFIVGVPLLLHFMGNKNDTPSNGDQGGDQGENQGDNQGKNGDSGNGKGGISSLFSGDSKSPKEPEKDDKGEKGEKGEKDDKKDEECKDDKKGDKGKPEGETDAPSEGSAPPK